MKYPERSIRERRRPLGGALLWMFVCVCFVLQQVAHPLHLSFHGHMKATDGPSHAHAVAPCGHHASSHGHTGDSDTGVREGTIGGAPEGASELTAGDHHHPHPVEDHPEQFGFADALPQQASVALAAFRSGDASHYFVFDAPALGHLVLVQLAPRSPPPGRRAAPRAPPLSV